MSYGFTQFTQRRYAELEAPILHGEGQGLRLSSNQKTAPKDGLLTREFATA